MSAVAIALAGSPFLSTQVAQAADVTAVVNPGSPGWAVNYASGAPTAEVAFAPAPTSSGLGEQSLRLSTGAGDPTGGKSGKPYLYGTQFAGTALDAITTLQYSTFVEHTAQEKLAPSLGMGLVNAAGGWQGTLVFEPIYSGDPGVQKWEAWNTLGGTWWFTRDIVDANGAVVIPRQTQTKLSDIKAAFAANPAKYGGLALDAGGVQLYAGQAQYSPSWTDFVAYVDDLRVGTADGVTTFDFENGFGPCDADVNSTQQTMTLTADCETGKTIAIETGWTIDGAGHTITAVEDGNAFPGPVLSAVDGNGVVVRNLTVNTRGFEGEGKNSGDLLAGVKLVRTSGSLEDVVVDGISHGNGVQEGNAIEIRNRDGAGPVDVNLTDVVVEKYQKTGILLDGDVDFEVRGAEVGRASGPDGSDLADETAANAVQISRGARGSFTDSRVAGNDYNGDWSATGFLIFNAGDVNLAHNVIGGPGTDVAVDVYSDGTNVDTTVTSVCNLLTRTGRPGDAMDENSTGIWASGEGVPTVHAVGTTFRGWQHDVQVLDGAEIEPTIGGDCAPAAPQQVEASGGMGRTTVTWRPAQAPEYAPVSGYTVTLRNPDHGALTSEVGPETTQARFNGLRRGIAYDVSVVAHNASGDSLPATTTLNGTRLKVAATAQATAGSTAYVWGRLSSTDTGADTSGRTVRLQHRASGETTWTNGRVQTTGAEGTYRFAVRPEVRTSYRVLYAGAPALGNVSLADVALVRTRVGLQVSDRSVRKGTQVMFTGPVAPDHAGETVALQRRVDGRWRTVATDELSRNSQFLLRWSMDSKRDFVWRVHKSADGEDNLAGTSRRLLVRVR